MPMSEVSRITGVFLEPGKAFSDIAARPRFWVPLILGLLMGTVFMVAFGQRVGWERMMVQQLEKQMETNPRMQQMSLEQRQAAINMQHKIGSVLNVAMPFVAPVMGFAMTALIAVFLLLFEKMMGADLKFRLAFAITCYAYLPFVIERAAATAVVFLKNPDDFNMENPTAFNLGAFLDPQGSKAVLALAGSLDLFVIWTVLLLATGFAAAQPKKLTFGKALTGVLIPWAIWIVLKTGLAALRG